MPPFVPKVSFEWVSFVLSPSRINITFGVVLGLSPLPLFTVPRKAVDWWWTFWRYQEQHRLQWGARLEVGSLSSVWYLIQHPPSSWSLDTSTFQTSSCLYQFTSEWSPDRSLPPSVLGNCEQDAVSKPPFAPLRFENINMQCWQTRDKDTHSPISGNQGAFYIYQEP